MDKYLTTYPKYSFLPATEKRFEGANSNFSKCLMAIKDMGVVDTKKNNVLVVLTNVMSFGNPRNAKKWHNQLKTKSKRVKNLGKAFVEKKGK